MDIESSRLLLKNVLNEHPELLDEFTGNNRQLKPKEKMETQTLRMPLSLKVRIMTLVEKQGRKQAVIIRDALEIGVARMEQSGE